MTDSRFVVAGSRPWNRELFERRLQPLHGTWDFVSSPSELGAALAAAPQPEFVFFLHWSEIVPVDVHTKHECVVFHMTEVPYGRGGSPLQNLIERGVERTVVSAIRMTSSIDAGPVYGTAPLSLDGTAEEIFVRAGEVSADLIEHIVEHRPQPLPQEGEVTLFTRRRPSQSRLPADISNPRRLYDHIRMLDAEGYPRAFLDHGDARLEFRDASLEDGRVVATVVFTWPEEES